MTKLKLGSISIYDQQRTPSSFIVADTYPGGGFEDPFLVSDVTTLYENCRYAPNYKAWNRIVSAGATLAVLGDRKEFNDYSTIAIFNKNPGILQDQVTYASPPMEDLQMTLEELFQKVLNTNDLLKYSYFLTLMENKDEYEYYTVNQLQEYARFVVINDMNQGINALKYFTGDNKGDAYTYKLRIRCDLTATCSYLRSRIREGYTPTIVLPRLVKDSQYEYNNYGVLLQTQVDGELLPAETDIPLTEKGITGVVAKIDITNINSNEELLDAIVNAVNPRTGSALTTDYYQSGEDLKAIIPPDDPDHPYLELTTPYLVRSWDFCYKFCDAFSYSADIEFTNEILYLRGLLFQGVVLSGYSRIPNKEGQGIELTYSCNLNWMNLVISFLDNDLEYVGDDIRSDLESDRYFQVVACNYETTTWYERTYASYVPELTCYTKSWKNNDHDESTRYNAYKSILEYEVPVSVVIAPPDPSTWRSRSLILLLRKLTYDHLNGGTSATLCIQLNPDEGELINTLGSRLEWDATIPKVHWFSGGWEFKSVYQYLIKFLEDKSYESDQGYKVMDSVPDEYETLKCTYNGFGITYDNNPWKYIVSMGISHSLNSIYFSVTPGMYLPQAQTALQNATLEPVELNPLISGISLNSIKQDVSTLRIDINIYYIKLASVIRTNFKIYKSYGN